MTNISILNERNEFSCFIGEWKGVSRTFSLDGHFLEETDVHLDISWKNADTFIQVEHISNLYQVGEVRLRSEIKVTDRTAFAETSHLHLMATALTPSTFLFRVKSSASHTTLHNVHNFFDQNRRQVVTHKFKDGESFVFQVQDFSRVHN